MWKRSERAKKGETLVVVFLLSLKRFVQFFFFLEKSPWRSSVNHLQKIKCNIRNDHHLIHSVDFFSFDSSFSFIFIVFFVSSFSSVGQWLLKYANERTTINCNIYSFFIAIFCCFNFHWPLTTIHGNERTKVEIIIMFLIGKYLLKSSWVESHMIDKVVFMHTSKWYKIIAKRQPNKQITAKLKIVKQRR